MTSALVRQLLEAGVHFGHQTKRWNPKMKPFIFGRRSGIYIIDLEQTEQRLKSACAFVERLSAGGQQVLFLGTKKQAKPLLKEEAKRCEMPYVVNRWLGGTLTNFQTIKKNLNLLRELRARKADGEFERLSKKEAKRLQRRLDKLEGSFSGLAEMERPPGGLFVVDTKREEIAVREANRLDIPVVAVCDTNADPDLIAYPIPGNDDAIRSIKFITSLIADSIVAGRRRALQVEPVSAAGGEVVGAPAEEVASPPPAEPSASEADAASEIPVDADQQDKPVDEG